MKVPCPKASIPYFLGAGVKQLTNQAITSVAGKWYNHELVAERVGEHTRVIYIDDISTTDIKLLVGLDKILRDAFPNRHHLPFAGISIVALGDFGKMGPVKGTSLLDALVTLSATKKAYPNPNCPDSKVKYQAAILFQEFKRMDLVAQNRSKDPNHTKSTRSSQLEPEPK